MDVILGLMATGAGSLPFTPLREASEQLFRHSCYLLTPEGECFDNQLVQCSVPGYVRLCISAQ